MNYQPYPPIPEKKTVSTLSIIAFILSFLCWLGVAGLILGIIDLVLARKEAVPKKHGLSVAAVVIGSIMTIFLLLVEVGSSISDSALESSHEQPSSSGSTLNQQQNSTVVENDVDHINNVPVIGVGDSFGNRTIDGVVTDADLDWKDYDDWSIQPERDEKVILITIKVTNMSDKDNYVSVSDFECYVDDVIVNPELFNGSNLDYNQNIAPNRSAVLGAVYVVPKDAESIELEYNPIGESSSRVIIKIL